MRAFTIGQPRRHGGWILARIGLSAICLWLATSSPATAARLDTRVTVDAENVTLGDLISGLTEEERARRGIDGIVYTAAPLPGQRRTVPTARVIEAARAHDIELDSLPSAKRIEIARAGRAIPNRAIERKIAGALVRRGAVSDLSVQLSNRTATLYVPAGDEISFEIVELHYQARRERFTASVRAPATDLAAPVYEVTGTAYETTRLPVLSRAVEKGELIGTDDVKITHVRSTKSSHGLVSSRQALIGMTPKRHLRPGQPVRTADITPPIVVAKGESVRIIFNSPGINLTAVGRALENGALGKAIRVVNTQTNRSVEAVVSGPGYVRVSPAFTRGGLSPNMRIVSSQ